MKMSKKHAFRVCYRLADLGGGRRDARPQPKFLCNHAVFSKNWNNRLALSPLPFGKSWIHQRYSNHFIREEDSGLSFIWTPYCTKLSQDLFKLFLTSETSNLCCCHYYVINTQETKIFSKILISLRTIRLSCSKAVIYFCTLSSVMR